MGTDGGVAGAGRTGRTESLIPSRASHQLGSCAGDRGAVKTRPSGAESNPETGTDDWWEGAAARRSANGGAGAGEPPGWSRPRCARLLPTTPGSSSVAMSRRRPLELGPAHVDERDARARTGEEQRARPMPVATPVMSATLPDSAKPSEIVIAISRSVAALRRREPGLGRPGLHAAAEREPAHRHDHGLERRQNLARAPSAARSTFRKYASRAACGRRLASGPF